MATVFRLNHSKKKKKIKIKKDAIRLQIHVVKNKGITTTITIQVKDIFNIHRCTHDNNSHKLLWSLQDT